MPRRGHRLLVAVVTLAGCGLPGPTSSTRRCRAPSDGIVSLSWTINAAPPDTISCAGIDQLEMRLDVAGCEAHIAPVPCAIDKWRYDGLPEGSGSVELVAYDAGGRSLGSGRALIEVGPTLPAAPTRIDISR